jgi:hypothetical protein
VGLCVGRVDDRVAKDIVVVAEGEDDVDGEVALLVGDWVVEVVRVADDDTHDVAECDRVLVLSTVGER